MHRQIHFSFKTATGNLVSLSWEKVEIPDEAGSRVGLSRSETIQTLIVNNVKLATITKAISQTILFMVDLYLQDLIMVRPARLRCCLLRLKAASRTTAEQNSSTGRSPH